MVDAVGITVLTMKVHKRELEQVKIIRQAKDLVLVELIQEMVHQVAVEVGMVEVLQMNAQMQLVDQEDQVMRIIH